MRRLWGRMTSINVQKVAWVLKESNLDFDQVNVGGQYGQLETSAYRSMNPSGRIPALEDQGFNLWESNAICRYLADGYDSPFSPKTSVDRASADIWMEWFQNGPYQPFIQFFYQTVRLKEADRSADTLEACLRTLHTHFELAEKALSDNLYLAGDQISLADVPFGACLYRYFTIDVSRPTWPAISAYYERLQERQAYQQMVMISYDSLRPVEPS